MRTVTRASAVAAAILLATSILGCSYPPSPATPTPAPPQPGPPSDTFYTLSGVVYELVREVKQPREGVSVYCDSCGSPEGHTYATTDRNGAYLFSHTRNGSTPLIVSKTGDYRVEEPGVQANLDGSYVLVAPVNGDTQFNIRLVDAR